MVRFLKDYLLLILMGGGFLAIIVLGFFTSGTPQQLETAQIEIVKGDGDTLIYTVELARTPEEIKKGLMFRRELKKNHGMLFLFEDVEPRTFWMKNTLIPLDIIFIKPEGDILHVHPMAKPHDTTQISSLGPAKAVLEINGGEATENGIFIGDVVKYDTFINTDE